MNFVVCVRRVLELEQRLLEEESKHRIEEAIKRKVEEIIRSSDIVTEVL
jgi:hypothetical protein